MSAQCLLDNLEVADVSRLEEYKTCVAPLVEKDGGRYVLLGGRVDLLEGSWRPNYPVMIEFPSVDHARRWYDSDEYRELKELRHSSGRFNAVLMEGLDSQLIVESRLKPAGTAS